MPKYKCIRCDHRWESRITHKPKRCPQCKSPYWDRPYTEQAKRIADRVRESRV